MKTMKKDKATQEIMQTIANMESKRLEKGLYIALPITLLLVVTIAVTLNITVSRLIEKDFFKLFTEFEYDIHKIPPQTIKILFGLWDEVVEGVLAITIFSFIALVYLVEKLKLYSYPKRFKQINKYKNIKLHERTRFQITH